MIPLWLLSMLPQALYILSIIFLFMVTLTYMHKIRIIRVVLQNVRIYL